MTNQIGSPKILSSEAHGCLTLELGRRGLSGKGLIAVLLACLDDSGSEDQRGMVVGGVVTDLDAWETLTKKWPRLLTKYDLPEFHMSKIGNYTRDWRRKRRSMMMAEFVGEVVSLRGQIVAAGADLNDFNTIKKEFGWKKWDPMVFCLEFALQMCRTYAKNENETFSVLLDTLKPGSAGRVARLMALYAGEKDFAAYFKGWAVETSPPDCYLVQAADLAACASFRHLRKFLMHGDNVANRELNALGQLSFRRPKISYFDAENARPLAEGHKNKLDNRRLFSVLACEGEE